MNKNLLEVPERMETERLVLRAYKAGDGPMLYAASMRNRDHLTDFESDNVLMVLKNEEFAEEIARELAADWKARKSFFIGIFEKTTREWAGQVYVGPTNWDLPEFAIGYVSDVNYERKGYITEAVNCVVGMLFGVMGAHRVKAACSETNVRSWRLLERCGFKREGHLRETKRNANGTYHGDFLYSLLQREFLDR